MSSYGTDAAFLIYAAARGYTEVAAADEAARDVARLVGSEYIDGKYRHAFPGYKTGLRDQAREWPRSGAVDANGCAIASDAEPIEIEYATYEAAYREIKSAGSLLPDVTPASQVKRTSETIGPISEETEYVTPNSASASRPDIAVIDAILAPLIGGGRPSFIGSVTRA